MLVSHETATKVLEKHLLGESIHEVHVGVGWVMRLSNDVWLRCHEIKCEGEEAARGSLQLTGLGLDSCVEPGEPVQSLLLVACMRRPILGLVLERGGDLTLDFGSGRTVLLSSETEIVDWQWCLGPSTGDPYAQPGMLACFAPSTFVVPDGEAQ